MAGDGDPGSRNLLPRCQTDGPLRPLPWRLGASPPPPPPWQTSLPPLLLLIDRRLAVATLHLQGLLAHLSASERQRHAAYRRPADQERFLLARAALRQLLGRWLRQPPGAVAIATGPHGKPYCEGAPAFNLSHSGDLILLAFHSGLAVGVDVEQERPDLDWRPIARRVFCPAELAGLEARLPAEQGHAFLQAWCCLEARLKACGEGMAGLERLRSVRSSGDGSLATGVWEVAVPIGYRAAVALGARLTAPAAMAAGGGRPSPRG